MAVHGCAVGVLCYQLLPETEIWTEMRERESALRSRGVAHVLLGLWSPAAVVLWCVQLVDTIAEIQERHDAVRDIERQLQELHQVGPEPSALCLLL